MGATRANSVPSRRLSASMSGEQARRSRADKVWCDVRLKPGIFLGSSGKQEKLLQALTRGLEDVAHVEPWTTSFNPGTTTLERLLEIAHQVDFAAFVFARDDWTSNSPL